MFKKNIFTGIPVIALVFIIFLTGCAATEPNRAEPFDIVQNDNCASVQLWGIFSKNDNFVKINGEEVITKNPAEIILSEGLNEFEISFKVGVNNRGILGLMYTNVVSAAVSLPITRRKNYALSVEETAASRFGAAVLGAFSPPVYKLVFYELLSPHNNEKIKLNEFAGVTMNIDTWNPVEISNADPLKQIKKKERY